MKIKAMFAEVFAGYVINFEATLHTFAMSMVVWLR